MRKFVVNNCFGGFSISDNAVKDLGLENSFSKISREDVSLISLIESKGSEYVSGRFSELEIIRVPDDILGDVINVYDGLERFVERHREWCPDKTIELTKTRKEIIPI